MTIANDKFLFTDLSLFLLPRLHVKDPLTPHPLTLKILLITSLEANRKIRGLKLH